MDDQIERQRTHLQRRKISAAIKVKTHQPKQILKEFKLFLQNQLIAFGGVDPAGADTVIRGRGIGQSGSHRGIGAGIRHDSPSIEGIGDQQRSEKEVGNSNVEAIRCDGQQCIVRHSLQPAGYRNQSHPDPFLLRFWQPSSPWMRRPKKNLKKLILTGRNGVGCLSASPIFFRSRSRSETPSRKYRAMSAGGVTAATPTTILSLRLLYTANRNSTTSMTKFHHQQGQ
ncbi:hypothetical protein DAPPUDRAFT_115953 [Daphnia pulex]|uniref:Uncharacterized protein n=1 Tax=Daphnia pulex TaxID=6669 RepID=E9HN31_DAPPU|nr:hypothetical protein DAPPUDRAFT_115953 [Daphnia pulex]|eukprot:EFX66863.1 hypothetical protein DAPPUDRAFT_115953 [Daphnia pulex]